MIIFRAKGGKTDMLMIEKIQRLDLGIQGENRARAVEINCCMWRELYPNGAISIYHQRPGETAPDVTGATWDAETGILRWEPTGTDTFYAGEGLAEIRTTVNGVIRKSISIGTIIHPAVTGSRGGTIESNQQAYIDEVDRIRSITENNAAIAQAAKEETERVRGDAEAWARGTRNGNPVSEEDEAYGQSAREWAEKAGEKAEDAANSAEDAKGSADRAEREANDARASRDGAAESEQLASHWAEMALQGAETSGFAWFDIDDESGKMYVTVSAQLNGIVSFVIQEETGQLLVTVND